MLVQFHVYTSTFFVFCFRCDDLTSTSTAWRLFFVMFCMLALELVPVLDNIYLFSGVLNQGQRLLFAHGAVSPHVLGLENQSGYVGSRAKGQAGLY